MATLIWRDAMNDVDLIEVGTHLIEYGGQPDRFCYSHQSFDCNLSRDEQREVEAVS